MKRLIGILLVGLLTVHTGLAQIRVSSINVEQWIKENFSGQGVVVGNVSHRGYPLSIISFTSTGNVLQVPKGLILSSGNAFNVAGFNNSHNQSSTFSDGMIPERDADLELLLKEKLYDICSIEFDFVPMDNSIRFNYQFGSDEYPEYVDSPYNDIFAFIISDDEKSWNMALVPGTDVPVSINTVNFKDNQEHYIDNNLYKQVVVKRQEPVKSSYRGTLPGRVLRSIASVFTMTDKGGDRTYIAADPELLKTLDANLYRNLRYDGITKKLTAQAYVSPYKKYHLKIIIADVSDNIYDSGVFIEDRSLTSSKDPEQPGFVDYPDLRELIDPNLILQGKKVEEIVPEEYKAALRQSVPREQAAEVPAAEPRVEEDRQPVAVAAPLIPELRTVAVHFDFDKSNIRDGDMQKLREAMRQFEELSDYYTFRLTGHTDSIGSMDYNVALSRRRNESVIEALSGMLQDKRLIPAQHKSFTEPVTNNGTDDGRQANRRVEVIFVRKL